MPSESRRRRRGRAMLKAVVALTILVGLAALAAEIFRLGWATGFAAAGGVLVVYLVPATIWDWPRLGWADVVDAILGVLSAIGSFFSSLFDW